MGWRLQDEPVCTRLGRGLGKGELLADLLASNGDQPVRPA